MALFGALLLVFVNCIRPQEFIPALENVHILTIAVGLTLLGIAIDVGTGKLKSLAIPQLPFLLVFLAWCALCTTVKVGSGAVANMAGPLGFSTLVMLLVAYGTSSFERLRSMTFLILCIGVTLASLGIREALSPLECIALTRDERGSVGDMSDGAPIGIECEGVTECIAKTKDFETEFACEKMGAFGTFSVDHGRVRWRGTMGDPNELAMFIAAALSFAFAIHASSKGAFRYVLLFAVLGIVTACVVKTGSRSGQLVSVAVLVTYFVRRYGLKGLVFAAFLAAPLLALGGRDTEGAESSSLERIGALYDGIDFFKASPLFGLGCGQFIENYFITAHNSYLLSAAELGFPGMVAWSSLVYVSVKIPYLVGSQPPPGMDPRLVPYGFALMTSFAGILVGIFFLSFSYATMLFMYFGLAGGLFLAVRRSAPQFEVRVSGKELGIVAVLDASVLMALFLYTRIQGAP